MAKSQRKALIRCLDRGYEVELGRELQTLGESFNNWRNGEITCWELEDRIHRFHNGPARDLYKLYRMPVTEIAAARAIALGFVSEAEVPPPLLESLADAIKIFSPTLSSDRPGPSETTK